MLPGYSFHIQQLTFQTGSHTIGSSHIITINFKVGLAGRHTGVLLPRITCFTELRIFLQFLTHFITDLFQCNITSRIRKLILKEIICEPLSASKQMYYRIGLSYSVVTCCYTFVCSTNNFVASRNFLCQFIRYRSVIPVLRQYGHICAGKNSVPIPLAQNKLATKNTIQPITITER